MNKPTDSTLDLPIPFTTPIHRGNMREVVASCERARAVTPAFVELLATECACGHELGDHYGIDPHPCGLVEHDACGCMHFDPAVRLEGETRPALVLLDGGGK